MEHALFLDQPIRLNPRRQSQSPSISTPSAKPNEISSPTVSLLSCSSPVHESDIPLPSETKQSTADQIALCSSTIRPQWRTETDLFVTLSSDQLVPDEFSTALVRKNGKGKRRSTKAACSACRRQKSKVRTSL